jgi:hypothetical protein
MRTPHLVKFFEWQRREIALRNFWDEKRGMEIPEKNFLVRVQMRARFIGINHNPSQVE